LNLIATTSKITVWKLPKFLKNEYYRIPQIVLSRLYPIRQTGIWGTVIYSVNIINTETVKQFRDRQTGHHVSFYNKNINNIVEAEPNLLGHYLLCCTGPSHLHEIGKVTGYLCGLTDSALDHRSLPPEFEFWCGHIWMVFYLWHCLITFGGCSAHLAYHVHKSGHKTSITKPIT